MISSKYSYLIIIICLQGWLPVMFETRSQTTKQALYICNKIQVIYFSRAACIDIGDITSMLPQTHDITTISNIRCHTSRYSTSQDRQTEIRLSCSQRHVKVLLYLILESSSHVELCIKVNQFWAWGREDYMLIEAFHNAQVV